MPLSAGPRKLPWCSDWHSTWATHGRTSRRLLGSQEARRASPEPGFLFGYSVNYRRLGWSEARVLENFPELRAGDLVQAWVYAESHREAIGKAIAENEAT